MPQDFYLTDPWQKPTAGTPLDIHHWASSPLAFWPMWEGGGQQIEDISGNNYTGTIFADTHPIPIIDPEGVTFKSGGTGIKLTGFPQLRPWSWVAIINPQVQPNPYGNLISVGSNRGIWINSGKIDFFNVSDHLANTTLKIGVDQHVAVTFDSSGLTRFYYNGVLDGFASTSVQNFPFDGMGGDGGASGEPYYGRMKSVMLFDYVLTADQIKALYERPYEMFLPTRKKLPLRFALVSLLTGTTYNKSLSDIITLSENIVDNKVKVLSLIDSILFSDTAIGLDPKIARILLSYKNILLGGGISDEF